MNKNIDIQKLTEVAIGLQELLESVVFIGGAVINLYNDDLAAEEIRPTEDIDLTVNLSNFFEWSKFQERLLELEFFPDPFGHAICSYQFHGIPIDIMPAENSAIGEANSWYKTGIENLISIDLEHNLKIKILTAPYFLATKFEAFKNRANEDYRASHDFEDIIFVLDNRKNIVLEIINADETVKSFLKNELQSLVNHKNSNEIFSMHIHPLIVKDRFPMLLEKVNAIIQR